jgi:hypothetical protein
MAKIEQRESLVNNRLFVCLLRTILERPPIKHRHTPDSWRYLNPNEFAVAVAALVAARAAWSDEAHTAAWQAGERQLQRKRQHLRKYKRERHAHRPLYHKGYAIHEAEPDWIEPPFSRDECEIAYELAYGGPRESEQPFPVKQAMTNTGRHAYRRQRQKLRQQSTRAIIVVKLTPRGLLRTAGIQPNGLHHRQFDAILERLLDPVGENGPAVLDWYQPLRSGLVRLAVNGCWLGSPFAKVPLPLPLKTPAVLALYLFLAGIDTGASNRRMIDQRTLYRRLGFRTTRGLPYCRRQLDQALEIINRHLAGLDREALAEQNIKVPDHYELEFISRDQVRFVAIRRRQRDDDGDEVEPYIQPRRRIGSREPTPSSEQVRALGAAAGRTSELAAREAEPPRQRIRFDPAQIRRQLGMTEAESG